jgi:adenosine deaminase CECR1
MKTVPSYDQYKYIIQEIKEADAKTRFDMNEDALNANEKKLDKYMCEKRQELMGDRRYTYDAYAPTLMFNKSYPDIINNELFQNVFKKMPTGGNLHIHTSSTWQTDAFADMLSYDPNVYVYWNPNHDPVPAGSTYFHGKLYYFSQQPDDAKFLNYREIADCSTFKESKRLLTFIDDRIDSIDYIWDGFNDYFNRVGSILKVRTIYKEYYEKAFAYQYDNGTDYIEIRAGVGNLVDNNDSELTQKAYPKEVYTNDVPEAIIALREAYWTIKEQDKYSDLKVKVIISPSRSLDVEAVQSILEHVPAWIENCKDTDGSDFILGFDLVSEEDPNHKTDDYAQMIITTLQQMGKDVNFYFHDGESNWADNDNVHAAYALGTKRVGHGLNIYNFPALMEKIKTDEICLEVCPISNQMLRYIKDLRIHPITVYMERGIQCVVCSDDPQIFETAGTYYDFWEVYHGSLIDLRDIKALIKNSYRYSGMTQNEKDTKWEKWKEKWKTFVDKVIQDLHL